MLIDYGTMFSIENATKLPPMKHPDYSKENEGAQSNDVPEDEPPAEEDTKETSQETEKKTSECCEDETCDKNDKKCSAEAYKMYLERHPEVDNQMTEEQALESLEKVAKDAVKNVKSAGKKVGETVSKAGKTVSDKVSKVGKDIKNKFSKDKGEPTPDDEKERIKAKNKARAMAEYQKRHPEVKK